MNAEHSPELSAEALELGYREPIISGLEVAFAPGKVTGILGANGSGKSTLLKGLARIHKASAGLVALDGENVTGIRARDFAKTVGLLAQSPSAPEGATVRDLVARGRFPHQGVLRRASSRDHAIVDEVIERVGLADLAERPLAELSGGQRQRAWIAMALAQQPKILLLDEPTTYLDLNHQLDVLDLLTGLNRERQITVVMVLHDLNIAARFCDHLIVMKDGGILAQGSPEDVLSPGTIAEAFSVMARVLDDPITGKPLVVPIRTLGGG